MPRQSKADKELAAIDALEDALFGAYRDALPGEDGAFALALSQATLKSSANYERLAKRHGLTANGLMLLITLRFAEAPCTQRLVSKLLWLPKQTVGSIVASLKKRGLITEAPSPADGRAKVLALTDEGARLCDTAVTELVSLEHTALEALPPEDVSVTVRTLDAYVETFERGLDDLQTLKRSDGTTGAQRERTVNITAARRE